MHVSSSSRGRDNRYTKQTTQRLAAVMAPLVEAMESRTLLSASTVLTGTVIGTPGSYNNSGNTVAKAFDGILTNFFDGQMSAGNYAGLDLGSAHVITQISYAPRVGFASRMVGGVFQASSTADFGSNVTTLYTITTAPASGVFTTVNVTDPGSDRYVRYLSPGGSHGDVAELQFSGYAAPITSGSTLTVQGTAGDDSITVNFNNETFNVDVNGTTQSYSASGIQNLVVNALGGFNTVTIDGNYDYGSSAALFSNITVNGSGNDTLHTSIQDESQSNSQSINVTFNGGDGQDYVDIEGGDTATINDGNGTDRFYTQALEDTLNFTVNAGNGNDGLTVGSVGGSSSQYGTANFGTGADGFSVTDPDDHLTVNADGRSVPVTDAYAVEVGTVVNQSSGAGVAGVRVFIDANNDGIYNSGEIATTTDANGVFVFAQLPPDSTTGSSSDITAMTLPSGYSYASTTPTSFAGSFSAGAGHSGIEFLLIPQAATGSVSGKVTSGGVGLANVTVYLDANNNSTLDAGELSTTTRSDGTYAFSSAPSGAYIIRQVLPSNQKQTTPTSPYGIHITIVANETLTNENFVDASTVTASIAGVAFDDANGNLKQDAGEIGLSGFTVYLDPTNTGSYVPGDPMTTTDANGNYVFYNLSPGAYIVRVEPSAGYVQSTPTMNYGQHVTVGAGNALTGANFGERPIS